MPIDCGRLQQMADNGGVGADVYKGGRFVHHEPLTSGSLISNGNRIAVDLPGFSYYDLQYFNDGKGLQPVPTAHAGDTYFVEVASKETNLNRTQPGWYKDVLELKKLFDNARSAFSEKTNTPCDNVNPFDLDYDVPVHNKGLLHQETGGEHIQARHIVTGPRHTAKAKADSQGKGSFYITDAPQLSLQEHYAFVTLLINPLTFARGQVSTKYNNQNQVIGYEVSAVLPTLPWHPNDPYKREFFSRQEYIGYEKLGRGMYSPTGRNTIILGADCKTVITSFPGELDTP